MKIGSQGKKVGGNPDSDFRLGWNPEKATWLPRPN
jgi:hypothetical protein